MRPSERGIFGRLHHMSLVAVLLAGYGLLLLMVWAIAYGLLGLVCTFLGIVFSDTDLMIGGAGLIPIVVRLFIEWERDDAMRGRIWQVEDVGKASTSLM